MKPWRRPSVDDRVVDRAYIANQFRQFRSRELLTQCELAVEMSTTQRSISRVETCRVTPYRSTYDRFVLVRDALTRPEIPRGHSGRTPGDVPVPDPPISTASPPVPTPVSIAPAPLRPGEIDLAQFIRDIQEEMRAERKAKS